MVVVMHIGNDFVKNRVIPLSLVNDLDKAISQTKLLGVKVIDVTKQNNTCVWVISTNGIKTIKKMFNEFILIRAVSRIVL